MSEVMSENLEFALKLVNRGYEVERTSERDFHYNKD